MQKITLIIITLLCYLITAAQQENVDYSEPKTFEIGGIIVNGANNLNEKTLIAISELSVGRLLKYRRCNNNGIKIRAKDYSQM